MIAGNSEPRPSLEVNSLVRKAGPELWSEHETSVSRTAPMFRFLFRALGAQRRMRVAAVIFDMLFRLEGRKYFSRTARELLLEHFGVAVGSYTYGDILKPGLFPPNVIVGRYGSVSHGVRAFSQNHPMERFSTSGLFYDPTIGLARHRLLHQRPILAVGHDVWLGENALITPGCRRIGHGAVIGAGSVVTHDVPSFAIVAGNPARVLRLRFEDEATRRAVLRSRWWDHTPEVLLESALHATERLSASVMDRLELPALSRSGPDTLDELLRVGDQVPTHPEQQ